MLVLCVLMIGLTLYKIHLNMKNHEACPVCLATRCYTLNRLDSL